MSGKAPAAREARGVGAVLIAIGAAMLAASFGIDRDPSGAMGARTFPFIGSGALILLGALELRGTGPAPAEGRAPIPWTVPALLGLSVAYALAIGKVGYLVSTGLAAPAALALFGIRSPAGLAASAILAPAIYHLLFFELLGVFPPYGDWFDLLDVIQGY